MSIASHVMMMRPDQSGQNEQLDTVSVHHTRFFTSPLYQQALKELDAFVSVLRDSGIQVSQFERPINSHSPSPDSIFSTNWISFHEPGVLIQYPLFSKPPKEKFKQEIIEQFLVQNSTWDYANLSDYEQVDVFLEGRGSVVWDAKEGTAYACESTRTHPGFFERYCQFFRWKPVIFKLNPNLGLNVLYTSSLLSFGEEFAIFCEEAIAEENRKEVLDHLTASGKTCIACNLEQMQQFACSLIQLVNAEGKVFILISHRAFESLNPSQVRQLGKHGTLLPISLNSIEELGGGGLRCIVTEVFEPNP